ncbi:MAG: hypothetical protein HY209_05860 [Candidatus Omnitrophica bacterium]|nr:hypothetical protein [Candidatus Omnitrophota bacterium]
MNKRGSIIFAFLIILVFAALGAAIVLRSVNEAAAAKRTSDSTGALWVAEAGVQKVYWEYSYNNCGGMVPSTACGSGNKSLAGTLTGYGDYDVTLNNASSPLIQSIGSVPSRSSSRKVQRNVQVTVSRPAIFGNGIFAQGQVTLSKNALVDSYNSSNGNYGGSNILHNGNVGSDGTTAGIIIIDNNATIEGNVSTGPGGTVTQGNGDTITGTISSTNNITTPSVVVPSALTGLSSSGTLSVGNNGSKTLSDGDYKYTSASLSNGSTLNISGNVRIYLTGANDLTTGNNVTLNVNSGATLTVYTDGTLNLSNNITINNISKIPANMQIYSTYTGANGVTLTNNGTTYAGVYAPGTDVEVSNNNGFYGAVVGKTVKLDNNGEVHYDEALTTMANPFAQAIISSWQEF